MPRVGITAYDLLISCPGDVNKYVNVVKKCIENFNRLLGRINNAEIVGRHWSTDSYSQSGDRPQELLNKQFVRECDAAVAIFWTKFGTATDKYESGTEEEIEEMLSAGKQVFMYFVDEPVSPSELNSEQYKKILEFREKYKDRGIYFVVNNEEELEKRFTNDITMYFLPLMIGTKDTHNDVIKKPMLDILDYKSGTNCVSVVSSLFCESQFIKDQENKIISTIKDLMDNHLSKRTNVENIEEESDPQIEAIANLINSKTMDAEITESNKEVIIMFAEKHGVELPEDFWNVGNLTKTQSLLNPMLGGGGPTYDGTVEEKDRYNKLEELYWKIEELNEYNEYFRAIDDYQLVKLVLSNSGTDIDEDIDIKLRFEKGKLVRNHDIPVPGIMIIDTILDMKFIEMVLKEKETESINAYSDYPMMPQRFSYHITNPFNQLSASQEYEDSKEKYTDIINNLCCFELFENKDEDVLLIHVSYLKHHTSVTFPSALVFKSVPESIEYEITSKHTADIIKGTLKMS